MNEHCKFRNTIQLMGAGFLTGYCIGCSSVSRLGDIIGRKPTFIISISLQLLAITCLEFVTSFNYGLIFYFLFGLGDPGKV